VAGAAGCSHNDSTIFVQQVMAPPLISPGEQCSFKADPTQPALLGPGILDVALRGQYTPVYLIGNQLESQANSTQLQTETSYVTLQGAEVEVTDLSGNQLSSFTSLASVTVAPASGGTPGWANLMLTTIDSSTIAASPDIAALPNAVLDGVQGYVQLVTYVRVFGQSLGGQYVESNKFEFPVNVCRGCLISFSSADQNACFVTPNCYNGGGSSGGGGSSTSIPCFIGQDDYTDCSQCMDNGSCNPTRAATGACAIDAGAGRD
jgi:hypothetical protein